MVYNKQTYFPSVNTAIAVLEKRNNKKTHTNKKKHQKNKHTTHYNLCFNLQSNNHDTVGNWAVSRFSHWLHKIYLYYEKLIHNKYMGMGKQKGLIILSIKIFIVLIVEHRWLLTMRCQAREMARHQCLYNNQKYIILNKTQKFNRNWQDIKTACRVNQLKGK